MVNILETGFFLMDLRKKMIYFGIAVFFIIITIIIIMMVRKEKFFGTDMWYYNAFRDSDLVDKQARSDNLVKISKGYLPGKKDSILENFENTNLNFDPSNYEIHSDYHRTIQKISSNPNPIDSFETPEFRSPKNFSSKYNYEDLSEVDDNKADAIKLRSIELAFKNIEKNKFYNDLLRSKCRNGNRSSFKNCDCKRPFYGEY